MNINYKTQAMIRYLSNEYVEKITQKSFSLNTQWFDCNIYQ